MTTQKLRPEAPALVAREEAARLAHDRPVITIATGERRDEALVALRRGVERGRGRVATLRASLRASPGFLLTDGALHTHPDAVREAFEAARLALEPHDVLLAEGPLCIDVLRARLAIAIVESESPALLSRDLRAVRHRLDLVLLEARPALLALLGERVLAERREPVVASRA